MDQIRLCYFFLYFLLISENLIQYILIIFIPLSSAPNKPTQPPYPKRMMISFFLYYFLKIYLSLFIQCLTCLFACRPEDFIADDFGSPHSFWELNAGPLKEKPVLIAAESSLQSQASFCELIIRMWSWYIDYTLGDGPPYMFWYQK